MLSLTMNLCQFGEEEVEGDLYRNDCSVRSGGVGVSRGGGGTRIFMVFLCFVFYVLCL